MKKVPFARASLLLLGTAAAGAPPAGLLLYAWAGWRPVLSAGVGASLAAILGLVALGLVSWSFEKPQTVFLATLAGGFLARMVLFGAALALLVVKTSLSPGAFVGGFFTTYVVCQILEIASLHRLSRDGEARA